MRSVSGKQLGKIVEQRGWVLQRITGSHHIYENPEIDQILSIPVHRNQAVQQFGGADVQSLFVYRSSFFVAAHLHR